MERRHYVILAFILGVLILLSYPKNQDAQIEQRATSFTESNKMDVSMHQDVSMTLNQNDLLILKQDIPLFKEQCRSFLETENCSCEFFFDAQTEDRVLLNGSNLIVDATFSITQQVIPPLAIGEGKTLKKIEVDPGTQSLIVARSELLKSRVYILVTNLNSNIPTFLELSEIFEIKKI